MFSIFSGRAQNAKTIFSALKKLERSQDFIPLEVETFNIRFYSVLALRRETVVVGHPVGVKNLIKKDIHIRFPLESENGREVRMKVIMPEFRLHSGTIATLCELPNKFIPESKRAYKRYNTRLFSNLSIAFPRERKRLRIVDMSNQGCKVFTKDKGFLEAMEVGVSLPNIYLVVGNSFRINLPGAIPRVIDTNRVGFQFIPPQDNFENNKMNTLITTLEKAEQKKYRGASVR